MAGPPIDAAAAGSALEIRTVAERVHDLVLERILSGGIAGGDPIRQDALAAEFGISKIPLREALARLEESGLVRSHVHRGYVASSLSRSEAEEVFALRLQLEPAATARASVHVDAASGRAADAALQAVNESTRASGGDQGRLNRLFHMALVAPGAGPILVGFLGQLHLRAERYTRLHLLPRGRESRASAEHTEMLRLWRGGEPSGLERLVRLHIQQTLADLRVELALER